MQHRCNPDCDCRIKLNRAADGLTEASRLLSRSILSDSEEAIEFYYAFLRMAKEKFSIAMEAYRAHVQNRMKSGAESPPLT